MVAATVSLFHFNIIFSFIIFDLFLILLRIRYSTADPNEQVYVSSSAILSFCQFHFLIEKWCSAAGDFCASALINTSIALLTTRVRYAGGSLALADWLTSCCFCFFFFFHFDKILWCFVLFSHENKFICIYFSYKVWNNLSAEEDRRVCGASASRQRAKHPFWQTIHYSSHASKVIPMSVCFHFAIIRHDSNGISHKPPPTPLLSLRSLRTVIWLKNYTIGC